MYIVTCNNIKKSFKENVVIDDFSYEFDKGKIYLIYGESGCGKSTLLNLIGKLDKPSSGVIKYFDNSGEYKGNSTKFYREKIAYLFQNYALIDNQSVKQNLKIALEYSKEKNKEELMNNVLNRVGLKGMIDKKIYTLSGGEQQRVALARVLLKENDVVLADEPTGNLDDNNAKRIISLFSELRDEGKTIIIATHDEKFIEICDERIDLNNHTK